jgi:hypothetical protein
MEKTRKQRKYTKLMQVLISPSLDEKLRQLSEEKQLRYSEIVRAALIEYLQKQSQAKKEKK